MSRAVRKFQKVLHPHPATKAWADYLMLIIFGPWLLAGVYDLFFVKPDPNAYACGGPGFADFGCTGGWEATVVEVSNVLFTLALLFINGVLLSRLINRRQARQS